MKEIPIGSDIFYNIEEDGETFSVYKKDSIIPKRLIKFYSLNNYNIDAVINNQLYASHPLELNDPFDNGRCLLAKVGIQDTPYMSFYSTYGILSLTHPDNWNNILMWGHYCNNEGFSIQFDYSKFDYKYGPFPMNYQNKLTPKKYFDDNNLDVKYNFLYLLTSKNEKWEYENEYRFLLKKDSPMKSPKIPLREVKNDFESRLFPYSKESILEIHLGYYFIFNCDVIDENVDCLSIRTNDCKRIMLINKIIDDGIKSFVLYPDPSKAFDLVKREVDIEKVEITTFKFTFKEAFKVKA